MTPEKKQRMKLYQRSSVTVMDLGEMDIWDGTDMALLREILHELLEIQKCRAIGVNMEHVKYIPSGFFGMMMDCFERGVSVRLYLPQPNVRRMLWFRQFFIETSEGEFVMQGEPCRPLESDNFAEWTGEDPWETEDRADCVAHRQN